MGAPDDLQTRISRLTFPLLWCSLAFMAGILLASRVGLSTQVWLILAGMAFVTTLVALVVIRRAGVLVSPLHVPTSILIALVFLSGFLGAARYQAVQPKVDPFFISWYNDREYQVLVSGTLSEPPDYRDSYTNLKINVESVDTGNDQALPVHGTILARVDSDRIYHYGDHVRLRGYLKTPPKYEDFSYREYLALHGIQAYMPSAQVTYLPFGQKGNPALFLVYKLKEKALDTVYQLLPDPEASLLAGILLGINTGLPADLQQAFKNTGTAHMLAISGFNIVIIAGLFVTAFRRLFGPRRGPVLAVAGIAAYTLLVGADAAVVRAALMGGLALLARQVGRRQNGLNTLSFVGAVMAVLNPLVLWDVGFQLSFGATLGLILYAEPFQMTAVNFLSRHMPSSAALRTARPVSEYFLFILAAQLTTLPIMAYHYQRISLVSLLANPFILPAQPPIMILGGIAVMIGLVYLPLGKIAALIAWPFVSYTIRLVELFDRVPSGVVVLGEFSLLFVILFYTALLTWTFAADRFNRIRPALKPAVIASTLAIVAILTWRTALAAPDGRLHLTFLKVGTADGILIETPAGRHILINGGPSTSQLSDELGRRIPPLSRQLDWLVVASTQEDQVAALPRTLERFPPRQVLWAGKTEASFPARQLEDWLTSQSIPITNAETGQTLDLGSGAVLKVLQTNPRGAILLIEWHEFRALLPIGVNFEALTELDYGKNVGSINVLLLAESGLGQVNPPEWIKNLRPQVVILSVEAGNQQGLPSEETIQALEGYSLLRTDQQGWISITSDGGQMWIEAEKP